MSAESRLAAVEAVVAQWEQYLPTLQQRTDPVGTVLAAYLKERAREIRTALDEKHGGEA